MSTDLKCLYVLKDHPEIAAISQRIEDLKSQTATFIADAEDSFTKTMLDARLKTIDLFREIEAIIIKNGDLPKEAPDTDHLQLTIKHGDALYYSVAKEPMTHAENVKAAEAMRWQISKQQTLDDILSKLIKSLGRNN